MVTYNSGSMRGRLGGVAVRVAEVRFMQDRALYGLTRAPSVEFIFTRLSLRAIKHLFKMHNSQDVSHGSFLFPGQQLDIDLRVRSYDVHPGTQRAVCTFDTVGQPIYRLRVPGSHGYLPEP